MRDIWNPWHGCKKCSEGCENCYMYYLDSIHDNGDSSMVRLTGSLAYPLSKTRDGKYKIQSGEFIRVCLTSDFFIEEADGWRDEAWEVIRMRPDVMFFILTKRPQRIKDHLPSDWGDGYDNVMLSVTAENQIRADDRLPVLLSLPAKHKGVMCAPYIDKVSLLPYLESGAIEQVLCGGENYNGARLCRYEWVKSLYDECVLYNVTFCFIETGTKFEKDNKIYTIKSKTEQSRAALRSGLQHSGKRIDFTPVDLLGLPVDKDKLYVKKYKPHCSLCASKLICNGCGFCAKCEAEKQ